MITRTEAFDLICDKIEAREKFTATLVASASDLTATGYLKLEAWIKGKGFYSFTNNGEVSYLPSSRPVRLSGGRRFPA